MRIYVRRRLRVRLSAGAVDAFPDVTPLVRGSAVANAEISQCGGDHETTRFTSAISPS